MPTLAAVRLVMLYALVAPSLGVPPTVSMIDSVCRIISGYHCDTYFQTDQQCGTDGMTYTNMCAFSQAHCQLRDLHIAHAGACQAGEGDHSTRVPGANGTYEFFCQTLPPDCGTDREVVCGSDGLTYTNL